MHSRKRTTRKLAKILAAAMGLMAFAHSTQAASTWNVASGSWSVSSNWNPANVPGDQANEDAVVNSGTAIIDGNSFALNNFTFGGGTLLAINSNVLTVNAAMAWSGGTIGTSASLLEKGTVQISGDVENSGSFTLNTTSVAIDTGDFVNDGTLVWSSSGGSINFTNAGQLHNNDSFNITGNGTIVLSTTGTFTNAGTISKSAGGGTTSISAPFNNDGTLAVSSGTIVIDRSGTGSATSHWIIGNGSALIFATSGGNPYVLANGASISNSGSLINAGVLQVSASSLTGNHLVMDPTTAQELYITGDLAESEIVWNRGVLSGPGTTTSAGHDFSSNWGVAGGRTLQNSGNMNWNAGAVWGNGGSNISAIDNLTAGTISNLSGANFNFNVDADMGLPATPNLLVVINAGTVNVATSKTVSIDGVFNNNGVINIAAGATLNLNNGGVSSGLFSGGANSTLVFDGPAAHELSASAQISTTGALSVKSTTLQVDNGATITAGSYMQSGALTLNGKLTTATANISSSSAIVQGSGTFDANVVSTGALFSPGENQGEAKTLHVTGNLTFDSDTTYLLDVNTESTHIADEITAAGTFDVGGANLAVILTGPNDITPGERFIVLHSDTASGAHGSFSAATFDAFNRIPVYDQDSNLLGSFGLESDSEDIVLTDYQVPEPTMAAILLGFTGLLLSRRRQNGRANPMTVEMA